MKRINSFSGPSAFEDARRKARFGHCDWVVWTDRDGATQARRLSSPSAMKECLLAMGTQGRWTIIHASCAWLEVGRWPIGLNIISQFKYGMRP
jgi:hypothetical protein